MGLREWVSRSRSLVEPTLVVLTVGASTSPGVNVIRYVEQNPLRAHLVHASRDWRWSSLQERLGDDRGIIEDGPAPLPLEWPRIVDAHLPDEAIDEIRNSMHRY